MTDPFDRIRRTLDIEEVARRYGLEVDRHHKALCIFHNDHHESMSFNAKNNRYRCWSCGASGSSIDLVSQLFGLEPLDAVKKIAADFNLNLDLGGDYKPDIEAIEKRKRDKEIEKAWDNWCEQEYRKLAAVAQRYWQAILDYKPKFEEDFRPEYVEAIHNIEIVHFKLDILLRGSPADKIALYKATIDRNEVKAS